MGALAGRRALVTGGSRGIGAAIVRRLAADGASVAFTYSASTDAAEKLVAEVAESGGTAIAIQADSADPDQVRSSVTETVTHLGGLDILVNNAGILPAAAIESLTLEQFDQVVAINVRAIFTAVQAALPHLDNTARIINIGSINADRVPLPGMSIYAMSKAAVAGLTRGLARELGPRGITVNNLQVGPTTADMTPEDSEVAPTLRNLTALGRFGHPTEVASTVAYLAGPDSSFITGAHWNTDGGFTV